MKILLRPICWLKGHIYKVTHSSEWGAVSHTRCLRCNKRNSYRDPRSQGVGRPSWWK